MSPRPHPSLRLSLGAPAGRSVGWTKVQLAGGGLGGPRRPLHVPVESGLARPALARTRVHDAKHTVASLIAAVDHAAAVGDRREGGARTDRAGQGLTLRLRGRLLWATVRARRRSVPEAQLPKPGSKGLLSDVQTVPFGGVTSLTR